MKEKLTDMQDRVLRSNRSPPGGSTKDKKGKKRYQGGDKKCSRNAEKDHSSASVHAPNCIL